MGIRFRCHHCEHELNLKEFQGGRRARCPACDGKFRVPTSTTEFSLALEDEETALAGSAARGASRQSGSGTFELKPASHDAEALRISAGQSRSGKATTSANKSSKNSSATPATQAANSNATKTPAAIAEAPDAIWYVRPPTGGQYGPADGNIFFTWLQDQRVSPDSLVWRDGWPQWMIAGEAFEDFFGSGWRLPEADSDPVDSRTEQAALGQPEDDAWDAPSPAPVANGNQAVATAPTNPLVAPLQARRKKQQSNYAIFIAVLAILAIALAVVLARVLLK